MRGLRAALAAGVVLLASLGCGSGLPELQPSSFSSPDKVEEFGRLRVEWFKYYNGPQTIDYAMLYADGEWIRIPDGTAERVEACEADGIEAIALRVHGQPHISGVYILQILEDVPHLERLCAFEQGEPRWEGTQVRCLHGETWDAAVGNRVPPVPRKPFVPAE